MKLSQPNFCFIWDDTVEQMIVCLSHLDHPSSQTKRIMEKINENMGSLEMREREGGSNIQLPVPLLSVLFTVLYICMRKNPNEKNMRERSTFAAITPPLDAFLSLPLVLYPPLQIHHTNIWKIHNMLKKSTFDNYSLKSLKN